MRRLLLAAVAALLLTSYIQAQETPKATVTEKPLQALPYTPSLDVKSMDKTADPCDGLLPVHLRRLDEEQSHPCRPGVAGASTASCTEDNQRFLWGILETLAKKTTGRNADAAEDRRLLRRLHGRSRRRKARRRAAQAATRADRRHEDRRRTCRPFLAAAAPARRKAAACSSASAPNQDFETRSSVIAFATAGGLGLPDRDYYTQDDDQRSVDLRKQVPRRTSQKMLELLGDKPRGRAGEAATIMEIETELAKASLTRVEQRDPYKLFHKSRLQGLAGA